MQKWLSKGVRAGLLVAFTLVVSAFSTSRMTVLGHAPGAVVAESDDVPTRPTGG